MAKKRKKSYLVYIRWNRLPKIKDIKKYGVTSIVIGDVKRWEGDIKVEITVREI